MDGLLQDLRYALRSLAKSPGFTVVVVLTLALGIGANTAIFSVVNSILLRPLPYQQPERLAQIWERKRDGGNNVVSPDDFLDWQRHARSFESLSAYDAWLPAFSQAGETVQLAGVSVSPNFFSVLGVAPHLGRTFAPGEGGRGQDRVVVITHGFWRSRLGGDANIIGKTLTLDEKTYTVIGVLPAGFRHLRLIFDQPAVVFRPLDVSTQANQRAAHYLSVVGRLTARVSLKEAQAEMSTIARQLEQAYPQTNKDWGVNLVGLDDEVTGSVSPVLLVLQAAVAFVLLIACVNVANLLLARLAAREKEMAVRAALGGGRWRIIRLLLTESALLAAIGGALGLLLAWWGVDLLVLLAPSDVPRLEDIGVDRRALGFAFVLSLLTVLLFGLLPAAQAAKTNLNEALKEGSRGTARRQRTRGALVMAQVALSLVLLAGSGLLLRSLILLQSVHLGFNAANLLTMRVSLPPSKARDPQQIVNFHQQILARLEAVPGAQDVAIASSLPLAGINDFSTTVRINGQREPEPGSEPMAGWRIISPRYFHAMNIPLRAGRAFTDDDVAGSTAVVIINESFARRYFPDVDPIGRTITPQWGATRSTTIVGVVSDFKHGGLERDTKPEMYVPHTQQPWPSMALVVRTAAEPEHLTVAVQNAIWETDKNAPISRIATMQQIVGDQFARPLFNALLLSIFAVLALLLAAVGIYGVMSYTVTQRAREMGIRMALGAKVGDVVKLVIGQGSALTVGGIGIGLGVAFALTRLMSSLLFGVSATDLATFALVSALLLGVAALACWVPARRAARVDPMIALRNE